MLFPTTDFAVFLLAAFLANWLSMRFRTTWKLVMIAASYVFYAWWDPGLVWLLALVTVLAQLGAIFVARSEEPRARKVALGSSVVLVLVPLLWFKYYGFISENALSGLNALGLDSPLPLMQIVLPIGISFYTFMAISYVVDVHRGDFQPAGWIDVFLYLSFFPHLVAGPIVRPAELIPQFTKPRTTDDLDVGEAARLIFRGLFKKVVISSIIASEIVDPVFADPGSFAALDLLFAVYGYAVVIYADFSGYTDIAIGVARLLGFKFPQNFDHPYTATSLQDFWRRWHITLSRWLRDYLYIPLGGSRGGSIATAVAIMTTMLIGGLWHGAGWTFIVWGAIHGLGQAIGHFRRKGRDDEPVEPGWLRAGWQRFFTFHVVCFGWIFFRATSMDNAFDVLEGLVTGWTQPGELVSMSIAGLIVVCVLAQYLHMVPRVGTWPAAVWGLFNRSGPLIQGVACALMLFIITTLGPEGVAPFIYFRF